MADKVTQSEALEAFDRLKDNIAEARGDADGSGTDALQTVATYLGQLEESNDRLSRIAIGSTQMVQTSALDFVRHGWDKCAEHITGHLEDQGLIKSAFPYGNAQEMFDDLTI